MNDLNRLAEIVKANLMEKKHEDWGFPRGWNEAFDFVGREIEKLQAEHSVAERGISSAI